MNDRYSRTRLRRGSAERPRHPPHGPADTTQTPVSLPEQAFLLKGFSDGVPDAEPPERPAGRPGTDAEA